MMACENRFLDSGDRRWSPTETPPALSPKMVMLSGFPPNAAMLSLTHCRAISWSNMPALPGTSLVSKYRKPREAMRY